MMPKRSRKSFFTPEGKVALMFLKMYTGLSCPKLMEQLWVLLIDERNQCPKDVNLGFIPQTVLNIIGYFKQCDLVGGQNRELARVIIKDADTNIAKNIARGIESNVFPQGTMDMIDHYIDKLMNGEF